MINLLPPPIKESYHYARRNTRLVRWVFALGIAFFGLAAISAGGLWYLRQTTQDFQTQASLAEDSLRQQNQKQVEEQVKDISDNLKLAVQVLSKQVLFSELLKRLAVITPDNATLSNLAISQIQGAVDITANTTDYNAATQLQVNMADPENRIFSKADIVSINCTTPTGSTTGIASRYPCNVTVRALFADDNPFLFVKGAKKAARP